MFLNIIPKFNIINGYINIIIVGNAINIIITYLQNLCNFLAQPNSLTHLDLSGTDTTLECVSMF